MNKIRRSGRASFADRVLRAAVWSAPAFLAAGPWIGGVGGVTLSWDPAQTGPTTGVSGGDGNWDSLSPFWYDGVANQPWIEASDANFAGNAGTVTLASAHTATSLSFATGGYTLTGTAANPLTLTGAATITPTSGVVATMAGVLTAQATGTSGIVMNGDGELVLTNSGNNWSGDITLTGGSISGTLTVGASNALPSNTNVRIKNGSFHFVRVPAGVSQQVAQITGLGGAASTQFGAIRLDGHLTVGDSNDFIQWSDLGEISDSSNAVFEKVGSGVMVMKSPGSTTYRGRIKISGGSIFIDPSGGLFVGFGDDSSTNVLEFNGGTLNSNGDGGMARPLVIDAAGGTIDSAGYPSNPPTIPTPTSYTASIRSVTINGDLSGSGQLTITRHTNSGTTIQNSRGVFLNGAKNNFSGPIVISGSALFLNDPHSAGDGSVTNTITLAAPPVGVSQISELGICNNITYNGNLSIAPGASAARIWTGANNNTKPLTGIFTAGGTLASPLALATGQTLIPTTDDSNGTVLTLAGEISGTGTISRNLAGDGTNRGVANLTHDNSNFSGPLASYSEGVLMASASNQLGNEGPNNNLTLDKSGSFRLGASFDTTRSISVGNNAASSNNRAGFGGVFDTNTFTSHWGVLKKISGSSSGVLVKGFVNLTSSPQPLGSVYFSSINPAHDTFYVAVTNGTLGISPSGGAGVASVLTAFAPSGTITKPASGAFGTTGAKFDITDNKVIFTSLAPGTADVNGVYPAGTIQRYVHDGRNAGAWDGTGIVTSQTQATTSNLTSIGVATGQQVKALATASDTAVWGGETVLGSDTLVMYTYGGDANLDGKINVDDYGRIDSSIPQGIAGWYNGDFNYDGKINVDDYGIIDSNIGIQGAPFPTSGSLTGVSAVPEPTGILPVLAACGVANLKRRRRRPKKKDPA